MLNSFFDQFTTAVRAETDKLIKNVSDCKANIINEHQSLQGEVELLKKERTQMTTILKSYGQIITLNVGGQLFSTTMETLTKEDCLFKKMFSGRYELPEHQGAIFIDRDPTYFKIILNYLRTGKFIKPNTDQERAEVLLEIEYYEIQSLIDQFKNAEDSSVLRIEKLLFDPILHHPKVNISENGLKASHSDGCSTGLYVKVSNTLWQNGRHYWEVTLGSGSGCYASMGVATSSWNQTKRLGDDSFSWALRLYNQHADYNYSGLRHNGQSFPYFKTFSAGTRVGILLDLNAGTLEYVIDGQKKGVAFQNLKEQCVTPVFELCHNTFYQMNHNTTAPVA